MNDLNLKGLLVDFGGVLTTNVWRSFDHFCEVEGLDGGTLLELFRGDGEALALLRGLERGALSDGDFERDFGELLGVEPAALIDRLFAGLEPEIRIIEAVKAARAAGIQTGLISNSWGTGIYERAPMEIFDATVISGDVGLHKPEPAIYELGAERLGLPPAACLFVDDLRENVTGAKAVGMTAILHREAEETIAEMERLLGVDLASPPRRASLR
ncbi:MAG: HAD family phosphatase [Solirubrobacterales bacterium]|nr:HAD family phosphatase [Solirubrobacterales bacterium]